MTINSQQPPNSGFRRISLLRARALFACFKTFISDPFAQHKSIWLLSTSSSTVGIRDVFQQCSHKSSDESAATCAAGRLSGKIVIFAQSETMREMN